MATATDIAMVMTMDMAMVTVISLDRHRRMKRIDMAIKLDHELRLTRRRSPDMQNFEADLSMMVPRPYESILGGKTPKYDFS